MSIEVNISVDLKETMLYMDRLPDNIKNAIGEALAKSGFTVERYMKTNAPVDTGRLRSSIFTELTPSIYPTRATISPHVYYAIFVHEGTRFIKANPFASKAAEQSEGEVQDFFDDALDKAIK